MGSIILSETQTSVPLHSSTNSIYIQKTSSDCNLNCGTQVFSISCFFKVAIGCLLLCDSGAQRGLDNWQHHCTQEGLLFERYRYVHFGSSIKGIMLEMSKPTAASLNHLPGPDDFSSTFLCSELVRNS